MYLGTVQRIVGSVLWLMVFHCLPDRPEKNMERVFAEICQFYSMAGTQCQHTNLGINSFVDPAKAHTSYPKLKGKGVEARDLVEAVLHTWGKFSVHTTYEHERVALLLRSQVDAQALEGGECRFLLDSAVPEVRLLVELGLLAHGNYFARTEF